MSLPFQPTGRSTHLANLRKGDEALVRSIRGKPELVRRLLEMGLTPGTPVGHGGTAPMGDPLTIHLRGYKLCLRREQAARIEVQTTRPTSDGQGTAPDAP